MLRLLSTNRLKAYTASTVSRGHPCLCYWLCDLAHRPGASAAGYATGEDIPGQQLIDRWEVPAGSDLRISTRSPAAVHVIFGEPDAVSVQVRHFQLQF